MSPVIAGALQVTFRLDWRWVWWGWGVLGEAEADLEAGAVVDVTTRAPQSRWVEAETGLLIVLV